ncbi:MarP family serine protease [Nocardioides sp. ChNu-153]|uniref:MarP family serine protease n=1 Tax=unclassified Nocardioides TaxID=2615069 RepID=UPI0024065A1C|nr:MULTISPECIES: MarP family serine protease [unclassified Nocardioides]MDF9715770.1 MarP family serine protease [Nocardioides sp. ChNu-99]MDN7121875.1 MarP family serine protease [Nocardioides sp. ChNu-153]
MNWLDWVLLLLVGTYALSGYWQGFITGAFATAGLLVGGLAGIVLAPLVLGDAEPGLWVSLGALFIVILLASIGQASFQYLGSRARDHVTWQPARVVDALGGAALSALAVLLVAWALGVAVSGTRIAGVTEAVRSSAVLAKVDTVLPGEADRALEAFNGVVGTSFFPRYLEPFAPERIVEVAPGDRETLQAAGVVGAQSRVLKIRGDNDCGRGVEGTGFLYADDRLMTNAHVVAGVDEPRVELGGEWVQARVVHYDPQVDVAVLALDDQGLSPLAFGEGATEESVAILGYPQDGPYDVQPARIRAQQQLRSPDIYGEGRTVRDVFSLRGLVRPGNSGGPVVDASGQVVGVIFAASVTDTDTGYALTAAQVASAGEAGRASSVEVATGACAA